MANHGRDWTRDIPDKPKDIVDPESLREGYKADEGKVRYDLIPAEVLREVAKLYTIGAKKYADNNWKKGLRYGQVYAAMMRHLELWRMGEGRDPDGQHHLDSVIWNAMTLRYYEMYPEKYNGYDDRVYKEIGGG